MISMEIRKIDSQGRLILPADWRKKYAENIREFYVIKFKGFLKIVPRKSNADLTKYFDSIDLGVDAIDDWSDFEKKFYGENL